MAVARLPQFRSRALRFLVIVVACLPGGIAVAADTAEEIIVTSKRQASELDTHAGNIALLAQGAIEDSQHAHVHELLTRIPGVWVTRGSGQESLPSIRSPVLTGPGSCGAFLVLENGVPTRPNGFCNVNQLMELPTELASGIEVIRGPGNALYGSNALHGTINVLLPVDDNVTHRFASVEVGANDFLRLSWRFGASAVPGFRAGLVHADDNGFRENAGYRQTKGYVAQSTDAWGGDLQASLVFSDLDQETAGFLLGEDAYRDPSLNRTNPNPEAFRRADSQRLTARWQRESRGLHFDVRPFVRRSEMEFLQHFLPGQPLEENGQQSAGVLTAVSFDTDAGSIVTGLDLEWSDTWLRQTQSGPTEGSDFLRETRPEGKHYDYEVQGLSAAVFAQFEFEVTERLVLHAGLRAEYVHFDYENQMLDGNTRDDGTPCGFGGCLYTRPASRTDDFANLAPKLGAVLSIGESTFLFANLSHGFRVPQMTELYRLQSGQLVSDLDAEAVDSLELGIRKKAQDWRLSSALFAMQKEDSIYRDSEGFNVSGGRSRHHGIESTLDFTPHEDWSLSFVGTVARHEYDFNVTAARGETFVAGRDVDTAPRWQGSAEIEYLPSDKLDLSLQWVSIGRYYLDAENLHSYPGHDIVNFRVRLGLPKGLSMTARINNITDRSIADRADYAFGNYRYFPGRGREFFLQVRYDD